MADEIAAAQAELDAAIAECNATKGTDDAAVARFVEARTALKAAKFAAKAQPTAPEIVAPPDEEKSEAPDEA